MTPAQTKTILKFMHDNPMAVIATHNVSSPSPESALIAFAELPTFEVIFETFYKTRKYENLKKDPHVSLVIGWDIKRQITLQYEGIARPLAGEEAEEHIKIFLTKDTPCTEQFLRDPRVRLYKVSPQWLRYSDYTGTEPVIIERTF